jgi:mono/diheme cytochrome c family protein
MPFAPDRLVRGFCLLMLLPAAGLAQQPTPPLRPFDTTVVMADTVRIDSVMVQDGRVLFRGRGGCFTCHGTRLEGGPVAPTLRAHAWKDAKNGDFVEIYRVIRHGVPGTVMVSHPGGISDSLALRVAAYIWVVSHRKIPP